MGTFDRYDALIGGGRIRISSVAVALYARKFVLITG